MTEKPIGLRERKKSRRRQEILLVARELFDQEGYAATTVDAIAEKAGISGVTVYNYFGSKSGVLLALVIESEAQLFEEIERRLDESPDDMVEIVVHFARALRHRAVSELDRVLWRQVFASSLLDGDTCFASAYRDLLRQLSSALGRRLERARRAGVLDAEVDTDALGTAFFNVQLVIFALFVTDESLEEAEVESELRRLVLALAKASR